MENPEKVLKALEGSAITLPSNISYHGSALKVEFTGIRGNDMNYYEWFGHWVKCTREQALVILERY